MIIEFFVFILKKPDIVDLLLIYSYVFHEIYIQEQKSPINEYYNPKFIKMKLIIIRTKHLK